MTEKMFGKTYIVKVLDDGECITEGELIRCEDCRYNSNREGNYVNCNILPEMFGKTPNDNYCSYAEREEECSR